MLTIIQEANVYDPEPLGVRDILLCGNQIVEIGTDLTKLYPQAKVLEGQGLVAIPGYIDQHVHIIGGGGKGGFRSRIPELNMASCVAGGVTTLVGVMGTDGLTKNIENLVAKTKALNEEGITAYCLTGSYEFPSLTLTGDLRKDLVFVQEIIGVKIAISDQRSSHPSKEELIRLFSEVRMAGLISGKPGIATIHIGRGKGRLDLLFEILEDTDLPIWHLRPTHLGKHEEQAVKFAKLGGYIDYTASLNSSEVARDIVSALRQGAPQNLVTLSSDANGSYPSEVANEKMQAAPMTSLHLVVKSLIQEEGLDLSQAISFVTSNVATALGIAEQKGRLRAGHDGDILLLKDDLTIQTVIARGRVLRHNGEKTKDLTKKQKL